MENPKRLREHLKTVRDIEFDEGNEERVNVINDAIDYIYENEQMINNFMDS